MYDLDYGYNEDNVRGDGMLPGQPPRCECDEDYYDEVF